MYIKNYHIHIVSYKVCSKHFSVWLGAEGRYQEILKQVEMDLVDFKSCQERLRETRLGADFILHKSFLCGGGTKDVDTCTGDGGGPLVCPTSNNSNAYIQVVFLLSVSSCKNAYAHSDNLFDLLLF